MSALANHMRITGLQVTNDDVDSRSAAIKSLRISWGKIKTIDDIFSKVAEVSAALGGDGMPSESLGKEVEVAVQKKASAFLYADRPLDVGIVAGMVAIDLMAVAPENSGWLIADVWAAALWSGLSFQQPLADEKREELRMFVLRAACDRSKAGAVKARERVIVPDFQAVTFVAGSEVELGANIKAATGPTIEALRRNAALDREELDFLWWAQLQRSRLLKRPLDAIDEVARVVASGIEAATYLRRFPCDVHREIVLRTISLNPHVTLAGVLKALNEDRETLAAVYVKGLPSGAETLLPLLSAIISGEVVDSSSVSLERSAEDWGARALLEAALINMWSSGPKKL